MTLRSCRYHRSLAGAVIRCREKARPEIGGLRSLIVGSVQDEQLAVRDIELSKILLFLAGKSGLEVDSSAGENA